MNVRPVGSPRRSLLVRSLPKDRGAGDDRFAWGDGGRVLSLCDGASEGWDGAGWAAALATALCRMENPVAAVEAARTRRRALGAGAGWLESAARERGSWATALVVRVRAGGRVVEAAAVGDTVLFILDGCKPVTSFPVDHASAFGDSPDLVAENGKESPRFVEAEFPLSGLRAPRLALVTDALAARALSEPEAGRNALWAFLLGSPAKAFSAWARAEIRIGRLKQDDLTLVAVV